MEEPLDLSPELQRASELKDMEIMRAMDGVKIDMWRYEVTDVLQTINERVEQYIRQMPFTFEFLVAQTLQDFRKWLVPIQIKTFSLAVAMTKDGRPIFAVPHTRPDFISYSDMIWSMARSQWDQLSPDEQVRRGINYLHIELQEELRKQYPTPKCFTFDKPDRG